MHETLLESVKATLDRFRARQRKFEADALESNERLEDRFDKLVEK